MYIGGSYFGDSDVLIDATRDGTALVDAESNLFAISKKDIKEVLEICVRNKKSWIKREMEKTAKERREYHADSIQELKLANQHIKKKKIKEFKQIKGQFGPQRASQNVNQSPPQKRKNATKKEKVEQDESFYKENASSSDENKSEEVDLYQLKNSGMKDEKSPLAILDEEENEDDYDSFDDSEDTFASKNKRSNTLIPKKDTGINIKRLNTIATNLAQSESRRLD